MEGYLCNSCRSPCYLSYLKVDDDEPKRCVYWHESSNWKSGGEWDFNAKVNHKTVTTISCHWCGRKCTMHIINLIGLDWDNVTCPFRDDVRVEIPIEECEVEEAHNE